MTKKMTFLMLSMIICMISLAPSVYAKDSAFRLTIEEYQGEGCAIHTCKRILFAQASADEDTLKEELKQTATGFIGAGLGAGIGEISDTLKNNTNRTGYSSIAGGSIGTGLEDQITSLTGKGIAAVVGIFSQSAKTNVVDWFQELSSGVSSNADMVLNRPGLLIKIASESGNVVEDLKNLDTNGLSNGIPVHWYIESFELWDQVTGNRYHYPLSNIPIRKGKINFNISVKSASKESINQGIRGAIGGIVTGGLKQPQGILNQSGQSSLGGIIGGATQYLDTKFQASSITLDIENNLIRKVTSTIPLKNNILSKDTVDSKSFSLNLEVSNGVTIKSQVSGNILEFNGTGREVTGEGLSRFDPNNIDGIITEDSLLSYIVQLTNWVLGFVGALAIIAIVYAGFLMVSGAFNESFYDKGRDIIIYAIVGIIIIAASYAIVNTLLSVQGNTYRANFELRDEKGNKYIGLSLSENQCFVTTLPVVGQLETCNKKGYVRFNASADLFPEQIIAMSDLTGHCFDLKIKTWACFNAPTGKSSKDLEVKPK